MSLPNGSAKSVFPNIHQFIFANLITEINDSEKDKLIHQMAYRCDPPDLPKLEDMLRSRHGNRINLDITPRSREEECKILQLGCGIS